jgi:DNA-binding NtrC family response regulator
MKNRTIMIIVDKINPHRQHLKKHLIHQGYKVIEVCDPAISDQLWQSQEPDIIIVFLENGTTWVSLNLAEHIRLRDKIIPLIIITCKSSETLAIAALKLGVNDYFTCPLNFQELLDSIKTILTNTQSHAEKSYNTEQVELPDHMLVGNSLAMQELREFLPKISSVNNNVLITGETGTGKECAARQIHLQSPRCKKPLVCLNCAALPDSLLESELFGFERGAFTGANTTYPGKLKLADGGSIFFDEIGDMSLLAQAKSSEFWRTRKLPLCVQRDTPLLI